MISEEPRRLGIDHLLPNTDFADRSEGVTRFAIEVKLYCLFQIGDSLLTRGSKTGDIHVETLSDNELILAINAVGDRLHELNATMRTHARQRSVDRAPLQIQKRKGPRLFATGLFDGAYEKFQRRSDILIPLSIGGRSCLKRPSHTLRGISSAKALWPGTTPPLCGQSSPESNWPRVNHSPTGCIGCSAPRRTNGIECGRPGSPSPCSRSH